MAVARSVRETFDYVLEADRILPADQQTVFHLRALSAATMRAVENLTTIDPASSTVSLRSGDQKILALRAGLAGWSNLRDADGREVEFHVDSGRHSVFGATIENPASMASLDLLQTADARELANAILGANELTRADAKN